MRKVEKVEWLSFKDFKTLILKGKIKDGKTLMSYYVLDKMEFLKCEGGGKMKNKKAIVILLVGVMLITTFASVFAPLL